MTQEQLKELADWAEIKLGSLADLLICNEKYIGTTSWDYDIWHPDKDSNQLDLLEDKMIKDVWVKPHIAFHISACFINNEVEIDYHGYKLDNYISGKGKTKNEARLNAIYNYVKGLK